MMPLNQEPAVWLPTIRVGTGADVFTRRLCDGLNARGVRAEIVWLPHRAEYMPWTVPVPKPPAWANVVHVNSWLPRRFWPTGLPVVLTVHHLVHDPLFGPFRSLPQVAYHNAVIRLRELTNIRRATAVTAVSGYVSRTVQDFSGREDVAAVPNWVDSRFVPDWSLYPAGCRPFQLFMAGSPSRRKGVDLLPSFMAALGGGFEVRYAGSSESLPQRATGVVELGRLNDADLLREYQQCDAVVSLSRYEGFGYTALEALACGKPFFGFSTSGLVEVVDTACAGLVENGDVVALANACRVVAESESLWSEFSEAALRRASQFSESRSVASYVEIYRAVSAAHRLRLQRKAWGGASS